MASDHSTGEAWTWAAMEPELSERERALRDLFVDELLVDGEWVKAAQRCGFQYAFAEEYAKKFEQEAYVQKRIALKRQQPVDPDKLADFDKRIARNVLVQEAQNPNTTGATRVAAARNLMIMYGMDAPTKIQQEVEHRGGVMMVPAIASLDDWERFAQASQQKLAADARSDIK